MTDQPHSQREVVLTARTPFEAQIVLALLRGAGIPAWADQQLRQDEFAIAQRLLNLDGVQVVVPRERASEARAVIADARADNAIPDQLFEPETVEPAAPVPERKPRSYALLALTCGAAAVVFAWLWRDTRRELQTLTDGRLSFMTKTDAFTWRTTWRANGLVAYEQVDRNENGIAEEVRYFDKLGRLANISKDEDEDGFYEQLTVLNRDGSREEFRDSDGDGVLDRGTIYAKDGTILRTEEHRGAEGWVRSR